MATDSIGSGYGFDLRFDEVAIYKDQPLGSGAYGIVCKAKCDQLPCAAKLLHPTFLVPGNWAVDKFMQECSFLASLKHPHIVQFLGVHTETSTSQTALFMELMDESLTTFLNRYHSSDQSVPFNIQVDICHDIVLALHYLHTNGIIHRDLSSNNVLLLGGRRAKITDFGMSKLTMNSSSLSSLTQVPGCPVYMPPEAWLTPPVYSEKLDMFSFGVLIIQIITCRQPNPSPSESLLPDERSPTGFIKLPVHELERRNEDIMIIPSDHHLKDLALKCLSDKAENRPSSNDLCQFLENVKVLKEYDNCKLQPELSTSDLTQDLTDSGYSTDSLRKKMEQSQSEVEKLGKEVSGLRTEVSKLHGQVSEKDLLIEKLQKELRKCEESSDRDSSKRSAKPLLHSAVDKVIITHLSPEVTSVLKSDPDAQQMFNVDYERDQVAFYIHPQKEDNDLRIKLFLQMYQRVFNSGQLRVDFIPIPTSFPRDLISHSLAVYGKQHNECFFQSIQNTNIIKVLSKSPELVQLSSLLVENMLHLTISLPGDRKLKLKRGSIFDEKADILVSPARPNLTHSQGLAATMNGLSNFELQKHCNQYIHKHGPLKVGQVAHTPGGGNLMCDWVIHAVGPTSAHTGDKDLLKLDLQIDHIMREMITNVLQKADKLKATSIVLPPIGSWDVTDNVASVAIIQTLLSYKYHSLKAINLVIEKEVVFNGYCKVFIDNGAFWTKKAYDPIISVSGISSSGSCKQQ